MLPAAPRLLLLPLVAGIAGCDWIAGPPNQGPQVAGRIPDQVVEVGRRVALDMAEHFVDPDGDPLTYAAVPGASETAAATATGSVLTVTGVASGETRVTATAQDPDGLSATLGFAVTVPNRAPLAVDAIPDGEVFVDGVLAIDVAAYFTDPDGDHLEYAAASSDSTRATVGVSGSVVGVTGAAVGKAMVTVTARDPGGLAVEQGFGVTVPNRAPEPLGTIAERVVHVGDAAVVDVAAHFAEPDGEELEYEVASSDTTRVAVAIAEAVVTATGVASGSATVTVTARDPGGLEARQRFRTTVANRAPRPVGTIPDRTVTPGDRSAVDAEPYFADPDGDDLAYSAASSDTTVATVHMSGSAVALEGLSEGDATVTVTAADAEGLAATQEFTATVPARPSVAELGYELVRTLPHDAAAFTQGLVIRDTVFFESTGLYGRSEVRAVRVATGEVLLRRALARNRFGEGLALVGASLIQLTWRAGLAFVYDAATLDLQGAFEYDSEGWGLCHDGESLYMSDGSAALQRRDPSTFGLLDRIEVARDGSAVRGLNELECVGDEIYANVFRSNDIVRIDKATGVVTGVLDAQPLVEASGRPANPKAVLNGIAHDPDAGTFHVTGKLWPTMFEIRIREK